MKDFQQKGRESAGIIINDNVDQSVSLMEYEVPDQFINHLINLNLPPFVVSQIQQLYDEMNQEKPLKNPPLNQISQKILTYNRKEKSLSQLTKKFIQKFEGAKSNQLVIDKVTLQMNVQRRRIYDIINIMQSLNVVKKIRKNIYEWRGLIQALKTIESYDGQEDQQQMYLQAKSKKERSLQSLSTQFLRLFSKRKYNSKNKKDILTLQQASLIMMSDQQKDSKKTKVRRLYDIVNVFKCMGLVRKIKVEGCKPGYQWLGTRTLIKIIENKNSNTFSEVASQQEPDQCLSQIHNNQEEQKNLKGQNQIQSIQIFQQDLKQNQKKYSRKNYKKYKSNRSNPNKIDSRKKEQVCDIKQIKLKKSQSCSTYMKNSQNQLIQNQSIKSRQSRFSLHQSCRQKNSCSPITTITKISNSMSDRSIKKISFYNQKTKKQRALSNLQSNNLEIEQFCKEERYVQQKKQEIYSQQIQLPQLERRKGKVPKKFFKKSIQLEASQSLLSSLLRGYRKIGLTTLDQLVSKLKQNLYNVNSFKSTIFNQNGLNEKGISQEQRGFTKLFQRGRQLKNLQKQAKCVSLLSNQKASIDQKFNEINIY